MQRCVDAKLLGWNILRFSGSEKFVGKEKLYNLNYSNVCEIKIKLNLPSTIHCMWKRKKTCIELWSNLSCPVFLPDLLSSSLCLTLNYSICDGKKNNISYLYYTFVQVCKHPSDICQLRVLNDYIQTSNSHRAFFVTNFVIL